MTEIVEKLRQDALESEQRIALHGIDAKTRWIIDDAIGLQRYVKLISDYSVDAKKAVTRAETALTEALLAVKLVKSELERKRNAA